MEEKIGTGKHEDFVLPGFRFHPTDEELVAFYLRRKVQHKPLPAELIKEVDIYKYDPWDLPKLANLGEKEWYFYCPRDRKYKNSMRPNRVTGAGFWKATGTDRPIYASDGIRCIGLKKSLVFYRGRAAKGCKTDWMMHEFRLPPPTDFQQRKQHHQNLSANESWAICRILKKSSSIAHRVLSQSWSSPVPPQISTTGVVDTFRGLRTAHLSPENIFSNFSSDATGTPSFDLLQHQVFASQSRHPLLSPMSYDHSITGAELVAAGLAQNGSVTGSIGFLPDQWRIGQVTLESTQCPSEMSTTSYSTNN